jgi:hypothetical protein
VSFSQKTSSTNPNFLYSVSQTGTDYPAFGQASSLSAAGLSSPNLQGEQNEYLCRQFRP